MQPDWHWLWLALLSAFSLASADAATKAWLRDWSARELLLVRFTLVGLLMSPLLAGLPPLASLPSALWGLLLILVPLELAAMWLYMAAIRDHPLSLTLPYLALTPVLAMLGAWLLLGERIAPLGGLGIFLVVAGAWLLNLDQTRWRDWRGWVAPLAAMHRQRGARLMLGVAALYALTSTLGKQATQLLPAEVFAAFYFAVLGLVAALLVLAPRPRLAGSLVHRLVRRPWPALLVAGLLGVMVYTHFTAIQQVEVAYMMAVKRTSLVFGVLYGILLFREPGLATRLPAGLVMLLGIGCLAI